jgi:hypothetical protein
MIHASRPGSGSLCSLPATPVNIPLAKPGVSRILLMWLVLRAICTPPSGIPSNDESQYRAGRVGLSRGIHIADTHWPLQ